MASLGSSVLPPEFGFVMLVIVYSWVMLMVLSRNVMVARKKFGVKYPDMYSKESTIFNCVQRSHQNTLEGLPLWLALQITVGLAHPIVASVLGFIWVTSRFSYAQGYSTGDPEKRMRGAYGYIGLIGLLLAALYSAVELLGWV